MDGVLTALMETLGPVSPIRATLWLASTIVLAAVLVLVWQRLVQR